MQQEFSIKLGNTIIKESKSERILGLQVPRNLEWKEHIEMVTKKLKYGLSVLRELHGLLRLKAIKILAEGILCSHIRYCIGTYLASFVRFKEDDPLNEEYKQLQTKQNDAMRLILGNKRIDQISRRSLLAKSGMKPINHMVAESIVLELWKAFRNDIPSIYNVYATGVTKRHSTSLRTSLNPKSFISVSSRLWRLMDNCIKAQSNWQFLIGSFCGNFCL